MWWLVVAVTYYALTGWFNVTDITATRQDITVKHKPLPWLGNKTINARDIKQLYGKEKVTTNRNSTSVSYEIHVITHSGADTTLVTGLETSQQALFIEQEIEKFLNIKNAPVRGEIG